MKVVLEGNLSEIRAEMREFLGYGDAEVIATAEAMLPPPPVAAPVPAPVEIPKAAPAKPKKAKAEAATSTPAQTVPAKDEAPAGATVTGQAEVAESVPAAAPVVVASVAAPAFPPATLDQARGAIAELVTAKGVPVAKALLSRFGVGRVQDAQAERFGEIKVKAEQAIAGTYDPEAA